MQDRIPTYPGRVKITHEDGTAEYVTLERADDAIQEGTQFNTYTILKSSTAAKFGKDNTAVPDDIFSLLGDFISNRAAKIAIGSYVGTGTYGEAAPNRLTFDFTPDIVLISSTVGAQAGASSLNSSTMLMPYIAIRGQSMGFVGYALSSTATSKYAHLTWGDNFIEWYNDAPGAIYQMNSSGLEYFYVAIGGSHEADLH